MKKNDLEQNMFNKINYTEEQKQIIRALENARKELEEARKFFDMVDNHNLIDYAIYKEAAAEAKYMYLLKEARNNNIKVNSYLVTENDQVV